jgi:hypothetical protein
VFTDYFWIKSEESGTRREGSYNISVPWARDYVETNMAFLGRLTFRSEIEACIVLLLVWLLVWSNGRREGQYMLLQTQAYTEYSTCSTFKGLISYYHLSWHILSSHAVCKKLRMECRTVTLLAVLYWRENCFSLIYDEDKVARRMFGPKREELSGGC